MFEKVNPSHPDKLADRIAGALVDYAYTKEHDPRIAVEVLLGHGKCHIIAETSLHIPTDVVVAAVYRIAGWHEVDYVEVPQDTHLSANQVDGIRCGDNGIFKGMPVTEEQMLLSKIAHNLYNAFPFDGTFAFCTGQLLQQNDSGASWMALLRRIRRRGLHWHQRKPS